jgi:hypothetical protein
VDFGDLSALEVRGQCAMIRAAVQTRLPEPEAWAVRARYGINEIAVDGGARRRVFSRDRYEAILHLSDWMQPSFPAINPMAVDLLVARAVDRRVCAVSYRQMAEQLGASKDTWGRALKLVSERLHALENMAIDRLTPVFIADGIVEPRQGDDVSITRTPVRNSHAGT